MTERTLTVLSGAALVLGAVLASPAYAQDAEPGAAKPTPSPASEEPAVNTSDPQATPSSADTKASGDAKAAEPAAAPAEGTQQPANAPARGGKFKTVDRLELESTAITGNRELPKVLYIVPWKKSDLGDLVGKPANSLLDEVLAPVDRDVFRRQTEYFSKLEGDAGASPAGGANASPAAGSGANASGANTPPAAPPANTGSNQPRQ